MEDFESVKRDFGATTSSRPYRIQLPLRGISDSKYYDEDDEEILVTRYCIS